MMIVVKATIVGPRVELLVNVFDLGHGDIADGLIGMNFLNQFNYEIRSAEGRIIVEQIVQ